MKGSAQTSKLGKISKTVPHRDHYARMSFLYQSSTLLNQVGLDPLARMYSRTMRAVARKNVLRLGSHIKRTICKKCDRRLIPGENLKVRLENASKSESDSNDILVYECQCGEKRRFPIGRDRDYLLWSDKVERIQC